MALRVSPARRHHPQYPKSKQIKATNVNSEHTTRKRKWGQRENKHLLGGGGRHEDPTRGTPGITHSGRADATARAAAKLLPNNKERRHGRGPATEFPGPRARLTARGVGAREPRAGTRSPGRAGATHPSPAGPTLAPVAAGARPGAGKRGRRGPG